MSISDALSGAISSFKAAGIESPELDASVLLAHILNVEKYKLLTDADKTLSKNDLSLLNKFIKRRIKGEPVAYITGKKEFYSIDFIVTKDVLIPRPETEQLVDLAIFHAKKGAFVLDVGTGSGAIAIALKKNRPDLKIYACDISEKALKIAWKNAHSILGIKSIKFYKSDLFESFKGKKFDLILSNPPYVDIALKNSIQKEILFEPGIAVFAENNGNKILEKIIKNAEKFLKRSGLMIIEIGGQDGFIRSVGSENGYSVSILKDYANLPRIALLKKSD